MQKYKKKHDNFKSQSFLANGSITMMDLLFIAKFRGGKVSTRVTGRNNDCLLSGHRQALKPPYSSPKFFSSGMSVSKLQRKA